MGTNYYLTEKPDCECCGRPYEPLHIGKSSGGWCFSLHVIPAAGIESLDDWIALWSKPGAVIKDEYEDDVTPNDMLANITGRRWNERPSKGVGWYESNHAVPGPNNLVRHKIDGRHCIGHGPGTYDFIIGEFC